MAERTEQQRVKEKIDGFLKNYSDTRFFGWTPELDKDFVSDTKPKEDGPSLMQLTRMPLWCPKCQVVMNKKLDNKMYWLHQMCFDCTVEMETQLRIQGKWEEYERNKIKENLRSYVKDTEQQVKEEKEKLDSGTTAVDVINEQLASIDYEKWKLPAADIAHYKQRMDTLLKDMHDDFEKTFGEKVHVQHVTTETINNVTGE